MRRCPSYLTLLLALAPLAAHAGSDDGRWYIDPYFGGISPDKGWGGKGSTFLYGVALGKNLTPAWTAELDLNYARLNDQFDTGHTEVYAAGIDVLRVFRRPSAFAPYVDVGAGATHGEQHSGLGVPSVTDFMAQGGVGAFVRLWENRDASASFSLRPDFKARWTDVPQAHPVDFLYVLGFTFTWGPGPTAKP